MEQYRRHSHPEQTGKLKVVHRFKEEGDVMSAFSRFILLTFRFEKILDL